MTEEDKLVKDALSIATYGTLSQVQEQIARNAVRVGLAARIPAAHDVVERLLVDFIQSPKWNPNADAPEDNADWREGYEAALNNLREALKPWWPLGGPLTLTAIPMPAPTGEVGRETLDAIAAMMSEFVDNWPQPKKVKTALALVAKTMRAALDPPQHVYWRAGEPDCPRELKAGNGELHTLRCKVCGLEDLRANSVCRAALDHTTKESIND